MKKVTVLYFAAIRDLTGTAQEQLDVADSIETVRDLLEQLTSHRATLRNHLSSIRIAKNETFVDLCESLDDGDVVALIPPVQGG